MAAAHGRFNGIRHVAPVCTPPMFPWAHPSPNDKRHLDQFSSFYTAHGRESQYFTTGRRFPSNLRLPMGGSGPPSIIWFLGSLEYSTQTASRSIQPFCRAHYCDRPTDRQTDRQNNRPRYSVCNNRPRLRM